MMVFICADYAQDAGCTIEGIGKGRSGQPQRVSSGSAQGGVLADIDGKRFRAGGEGNP